MSDTRRRFHDAMLILGQGMTVTRVGSESGRADEQYLPMSGSRLNFGNFERVRDQLAATGVTIQPRRQVVAHPAGWQVTDSDFLTVDKVLAQAVAVELDRIDPLPGGIYRVGENGPEGSP